jgi:hypothetical protein
VYVRVNSANMWLPRAVPHDHRSTSTVSVKFAHIMYLTNTVRFDFCSWLSKVCVGLSVHPLPHHLAG